MLNVAYSCGDTYSEYACISMLSLFDNNKDIDYIQVFVTDLGISEKNRKRLITVAEQYGRSITFIQQDDELIRDYLGQKIPLHGGNLATYGKLLASRVYPEWVEKLLFIDADTLVVGSLTEIEKLDMKGYLVAAVPGVDIYANLKADKEGELLRKRQIYFNCGVVIINLKEWNETELLSKFQEAIQQGYTDMKDQSMLNYSIPDSKLLRLHLKYNCSVHSFPDCAKKFWQKHLYPCSAQEVEEAYAAPIIIHYKWVKGRPWFHECINTKKDDYLYYKRLSPFRESAELSIFTDGFLSNTKGLKMLLHKLYFATYQTHIGSIVFVIRRVFRMRKHSFTEVDRRKS